MALIAAPALAQQAPEPDSTLTGRILSSDGTPVAGITVRAAPVAGEGMPFEGNLPPVEVGTPVYEAVTDASGTYRLTIPAPWLYELDAYTSGLTPHILGTLGVLEPQEQAEPLRLDTSNLLVLNLRSGASPKASGPLADGSTEAGSPESELPEAGSPVAGATLLASLVDFARPSLLRGDRRQLITLRSGSNGRVALSLPPYDTHPEADGGHRLEIRTPDHRPLVLAGKDLPSTRATSPRSRSVNPVTLEPLLAPQPYRLVAPDGSPVTRALGLDESGQPVPLRFRDDGAVIAAWPMAEGTGSSPATPYRKVRLFAGNNLYLEVEARPPSTPNTQEPAANARSSEGNPEGEGASEGDSDSEGQSEGTPPILQMEALPMVSGTVTDAVTGDPVAGALLCFRSPRHCGVADAAGNFRLARWGRTLTAAARGYQPSRQRLGIDPKETHDRFDILLQPATSIVGWVVDLNGAPVVGAVIENRPTESQGFVSGPQRYADANGRFHLPSLAPETTLVLVARAEGYIETRHTMTTPALGAAPREVRLVLDPGLRVVGRVLAETEEPVAEARVTLTRSPGSSARQQGPEFLMERLRDMEQHATNAAGRWERRGIEAGRYDLMVSADGASPVMVRGLMVEGAAGETGGTVDLGDVLLAPGASVAGYILDSQGQPLEGAEVHAVSSNLRLFRMPGPDGLPDYSTFTAADGSFVVEDLTPGEPVGVFVRKSGYVQQNLPGVEPPTLDLEIRMPPAARLTGQVVDGQRRPVVAAMVRLGAVGGSTSPEGTSSLRQDQFFAHSREDGSFTIEAVSAGRYRLSVSASEYQTMRYPQELEMAPGDERSGLEIVLRKGPEIQGTVRTADGEPVRGAVLKMRPSILTDPMQAFGGGGTTREDGTYSLTNLQAGTHVVTVDHASYQALRREIEITEAPLQRFDFTLIEGLTLGGRVVSNDGLPLADAEVRLDGENFGRSWSRQRQITDAEGRWSFEELAEGEYRVWAEHSEYASTPTRTTVTLDGSPLTDIELILEAGGRLSGRILGLDFDALASVQVSAYRNSEDDPEQVPLRRSGTVDYEGRWSVESAAPGSWTVTARTPEGNMVREEVELASAAGEAFVDLDFSGGASLTGQLLVDGEPLAGALVHLHGETGIQSMATTDYQGRFRFLGVENGAYRLQPRHRNLAIFHQEPVYLSGDDTVEVYLQRQALRVTVLAAETGLPLPSAQVQLSDAVAGSGLRYRGADQLDANGELMIYGVFSPTTRVVAVAKGYSALTMPLDARAQQPSLEVILTLLPIGDSEATAP